MDPAEVAWRSRAACKPKTRDPQEVTNLHKLFFHVEGYVQAKKLCGGCEVREHCAEWAVLWDYRCYVEGREWDMLHGIWGGMDGGERWMKVEKLL